MKYYRDIFNRLLDWFCSLTPLLTFLRHLRELIDDDADVQVTRWFLHCSVYVGAKGQLDGVITRTLTEGCGLGVDQPQNRRDGERLLRTKPRPPDARKLEVRADVNVPVYGH